MNRSLTGLVALAVDGKLVEIFGFAKQHMDFRLHELYDSILTSLEQHLTRKGSSKAALLTFVVAELYLRKGIKL